MGGSGLKTSRRGQRKPGARSAFGTLEGGVTLGPRVNEAKVFSFFFPERGREQVKLCRIAGVVGSSRLEKWKQVA
jgi:hypothetical protein